MGCDVFLNCRNDGTEFGGSIYQKVNDNLETAVNLAWTAGNSNTHFGIAAKYQIDADASFSVRVKLALPLFFLLNFFTDQGSHFFWHLLA